MTPAGEAEHDLSRILARQRTDARAVHQMAQKTRTLIAETRRLLADPIWRRMTSACPGDPGL